MIMTICVLAFIIVNIIELILCKYMSHSLYMAVYTAISSSYRLMECFLSSSAMYRIQYCVLVELN